MDELLIARAEKAIRHAPCLDLTVNQEDLVNQENLRVKDHDKVKQTKYSTKQENIKTERIPKERKMDTRSVHFSNFKEQIVRGKQAMQKICTFSAKQNNKSPNVN